MRHSRRDNPEGVGRINVQMPRTAEVMKGQAVPLPEDKGGIYSQPSSTLGGGLRRWRWIFNPLGEEKRS